MFLRLDDRAPAPPKRPKPLNDHQLVQRVLRSTAAVWHPYTMTKLHLGVTLLALVLVPSRKRSALLCPDSIAKVQADNAAKVELLLGCLGN